MLNAFTVDVEDYFHVSAFESTIDRKTWSDYPGRIHESLPRLLDLLETALRRQLRKGHFLNQSPMKLGIFAGGWSDRDDGDNTTGAGADADTDTESDPGNPIGGPAGEH